MYVLLYRSVCIISSINMLRENNTPGEAQRIPRTLNIALSHTTRQIQTGIDTHGTPNPTWGLEPEHGPVRL